MKVMRVAQPLDPFQLLPRIPRREKKGKFKWTKCSVDGGEEKVTQQERDKGYQTDQPSDY